jgi:hypothetical protein
VQYYKPEELPYDLVVYMGIDLAISTKETADYTAMSVIGEDQDTGFFMSLILSVS